VNDTVSAQGRASGLSLVRDSWCSFCVAKNATSSSYSIWFEVSATPAPVTEPRLWYHQSIRSPGLR
jgi:hypothetical protein